MITAAELREDYAHWQDDGCEVAPSCLSCPLAVCKYDLADSIVLQQRARLALYTEIVKLRHAGYNYESIAAKLHVSRRAVSEATRTTPLVSELQRPLFEEFN